MLSSVECCTVDIAQVDALAADAIAMFAMYTSIRPRVTVPSALIAVPAKV